MVRTQKLVHAGESFCVDDLEDLEALLLKLRGIGCNFPDGVLEAIAEERKEESTP